MSTLRAARPRTAARLFALYAVASVAVIAVFGFLMVRTMEQEADRRSLSAGESRASLIARTAVEPILARGNTPAEGLTAEQRKALGRVAQIAINEGKVLEVRLRDMSGEAVWPLPDGPAEQRGAPSSERHLAEGLRSALDGVASPAIVPGGTGDGPVGPAASAAAQETQPQMIAVFQPVHQMVAQTGNLPQSGREPSARPVRGEQIGVLEVDLPYDGIAADMSQGAKQTYLVVGAGLLTLYLVLGLISLVTTRRLGAHMRRNAHLAQHDQLTGLLNRTSFAARLERLAEDGAPAGITVIALLDIDRFAQVNDSLGHANGDLMLIEVARRMRRELGPLPLLARLGGDEFGVLLSAASEQEAADLLERVCLAVQEPIFLAELPVTVEASAGYVVAGQNGAGTGSELLRHADVALAAAKESGRTVHGYLPEHNSFDADRLVVVGELRRALAEGELRLHYQPKLRLGDGSLLGVEALLRWRHPRRGLLSPDKFLPLAEQTGLIEPLTEWVISTALREARNWDAVRPGVCVSVNVSARNLTEPRFSERVFGALRAFELSPNRLCLEITETAMFIDPHRARAVLTDLDAGGIPVSLDDFGQGQTSLRHLSALPLTEVKIDREFVKDMVTNPAHAAIVRSVVELAHMLGLLAVAEGVEDVATLAALRDLGCDAVQGYVLTRPLPAAELNEWISGRLPAPRTANLLSFMPAAAP